METSWKLGLPAKYRQITYVTEVLEVLKLHYFFVWLQQTQTETFISLKQSEITDKQFFFKIESKVLIYLYY